MCISLTIRSLSLRVRNASYGRGNPSGLAKHGRLVCPLTGAQWIATDFQPSRGQGRVSRFLGISLTTHNLSLRGRNGSDGRGNPSGLEGTRTACLFAYGCTVDRHGLRPPDDKLRQSAGRFNHCLSLRGGNGSDGRGNPSCLAKRGRFVCSLTGSQWIATGFQPSR